ncbi:zinc ribbon domain-containing protein [Mycobacterium sp.]|uniref:zinc ribbon domain-containing protein n=1 Tax=Mycobacterium sp. TaxID=1785 RepID=UPI0031DF2717
MKALVEQQRSLLEVAQLDAELARIAHRAGHLPQRQDCQRAEADHVAATDRLAAVRIALEDLDTQVSRLESEIDAVRRREERDRALLDSVADAKQLADLQHELETLQRRQSSLEDTLLEVMERREELQTRENAEVAAIAGLQAELADAQRALETAQADIDATRSQCMSRRDELTAALDPELLALYERQRAGGGPGAGPLQGRRCGACRIEIDRGELSRIAAASDDDVLRCPECGAILLRVADVGPSKSPSKSP